MRTNTKINISLGIIKFEKKIEELRHNKTLPLHLIINEITCLHNQLSNLIATEKNKIRIEQLKTQLIELFYIKLNYENNINHKPEKSIPCHRKIFNYCSSAVGTFLAGIAGFTTIKSIFETLLNVSNPVSLVSGIVTGVLEATVFIGIDVLDAKKIGAASRKLNPCMIEYEKQLEMTKLAQKVLLSSRAVKKFSSDDYIKSHKLTSILQKDIKRKNDELTNICVDSVAKKTAKTFFSVIGGVLCTGSGIIAGKGLLSALGAVSLFSTPVGWVVGGLLGAFSLATFIYSRKNSIVGMFDKFIQLHKKLKKSQDKFIASNQKYHNRVNEIIDDKINDELKEEAINDRIITLEDKIKKLQSLVDKQTFTSSTTIVHAPQEKKYKSNLRSSLYYNTQQINDRLFFRKKRQLDSSSISAMKIPLLASRNTV